MIIYFNLINVFTKLFHRFDFVIKLRKPNMEEILRKQLRGFIHSLVPIGDSDWNLFTESLFFKEYEKGELLLRSGEVENFMYFLAEGVTRIFQNKNNTEYTLRFNFPISAFNSYVSFITLTPSLINVEAITDIKVFRISYNDMQNLYEQSKMAERIGRRMIELLYVQRELKELKMNSQTAEGIYHDLLKDNTELTLQIPQKYLASYLGITPESLSRIKNKIKTTEV